MHPNNSHNVQYKLQWLRGIAYVNSVIVVAIGNQFVHNSRQDHNVRC